ncbi:MAG: hypothetical protein HC906_05040 [Bacteroidales bacterium]|nr:hypothetical protein [Bacteroidales bacterium]
MDLIAEYDTLQGTESKMMDVQLDPVEACRVIKWETEDADMVDIDATGKIIRRVCGYNPYHGIANERFFF